ncbi:hypothetical protein EYF80_018387 [Liparis tanakae]|uniref:Uncharacterized protein n=1 Tax=Liparis tanakae TaxID=230148 RepID=A0A4Z2I0M2_9TELE|nr:hypothetical protein EYF80_018387 [Liparis tanakae]
MKPEERPRKRHHLANRPQPHAHRGVLWGAIPDRERHRKSRRKQSEWAVRGGPGLSAAAGLAKPPDALGEPSATVLINVNEDGGDFR